MNRNFTATVRADGTVKPCCAFHGDKLDFGNIYQTKIQEMQNSQQPKVG